MLPIPFRSLGAALILSLAGNLPAQSKPAADPLAVPWKLVPPAAGVPCPSHETKLDAPTDLVAGEFPLSVHRPPVVDGDTLRVDGLDGSIRFIGLDCEETFKDKGKARLARENWDEYVKTETAGKESRRPPKYATPMGMAAKSGLEAMLQGVDKVRLEYDEPDRKRDGFGRHLCFVLAKRDGVWVNLNVEIVRQGLSPYFVKYGRSRRRHDAFVAAESEARSAKRGIWGPLEPIRHYGDYELRLVWWRERDESDRAARAARAKNENIFILGTAAEWERLKTFVGRPVTVVSTISAFRERGGMGLLSLVHADKNDFMVVGKDSVVVELQKKPKEFEGDLVFVTGVVALYEGRPQFVQSAETPVRFDRKPPAAPESAPASK